DFLRNVVELFTSRMADAGINLSFKEQLAGSVRVSGDQRRLVQLFANLLENALKYTNPGEDAQVLVDLSLQAQHVNIVIEDSPPAVADTDYEQMFERLYRVEHSRARAKGGSGLGLSICRSIVEAHAGTIRATASNLGGVRILIELPVRTR
ncbi:ATP-binding protein, partial [Gammaproteobacteria bacterium]|nr:ATP-binding protein [Gammaproteobacteria bacterium]